MADPVKVNNLDSLDAAYNQIYKIDKTTSIATCFESHPYSFVSGKNIFDLPINPSNIQITTLFGTTLTPTLYGTVEEHTDQRYFNISITGTTGIVPNSYRSRQISGATGVDDKSGLKGWDAFVKQASNYWDNATGQGSSNGIGRESFSVYTDPLGGFARRTANLVAVAGGAADATADLWNNTFGAVSDTQVSAFSYETSGYVAFHNLYRFLINYKKIITDSNGQVSSNKGLLFLNYKDNNQYNVVVDTFTLTRSADDPMLYNYNISMRAYNLSGIGSDNVSPKTKDTMSSLGLDGVASSSIFSTISNLARGAKNTAYAAIAAVKNFGA